MLAHHAIVIAEDLEGKVSDSALPDAAWVELA